MRKDRYELMKDIKEEFKMYNFIDPKLDEINDRLEDIKEHYSHPLPVKIPTSESDCYNINDIKSYEAIVGLFSIISDLIKEVDQMKNRLDYVERNIP